MPAETHVERGTPMDRQQVFELIRDRLADILEIDPARHLRGRKLRRRPRGRLPRPDRAGRGPRGGAQRALGRLPDRRRGPRGPEDGARRRRLRRRPAVGVPISLPVPRLAQLIERLGLDLAPDLLAPALVHRSWCAENAGHPSNERLEFLGDAVLGVVVTDHVYRIYPDLDEGALTEIRKTVVNSVALAEVAAGPRRRRPPAARQGRGAVRAAARSRRSWPTPWRRSSAPPTSAAGWRRPPCLVLGVLGAPAGDGPGRRRRPQEPPAGAVRPPLRHAAALRGRGQRPRPRPHASSSPSPSAAWPTARARAAPRSRPSRPPPAPRWKPWSTTNPTP